METMTNAINWFEIPASDFERAKKFYSTIYNYEMQEIEAHNVKMGILPHDQEKGIGGAICAGKGYASCEKGLRIYLNGGRDLSIVLDRVEVAGGKVEIAKTSIGDGEGYFAEFIDTEGNRIGLYSME